MFGVLTDIIGIFYLQRNIYTVLEELVIFTFHICIAGFAYFALKINIHRNTIVYCMIFSLCIIQFVIVVFFGKKTIIDQQSVVDKLYARIN